MQNKHYLDRRKEYRHKSNHRAWGCGFVVGIASTLIVLLAWLAPLAHANTTLPPHYAQWVKTCRAEQPATLPGYRGDQWKGVAWSQTINYSYRGGCGFTQSNWSTFKRRGQPEYMSNATPVEQLWACERIYTFYLKESGSHRYAATVWDANKNMLGWYGFTKATWNNYQSTNQSMLRN